MSKSNPVSNTKQLPLPIEGATIEVQLTKGYTAIIDAVDGAICKYIWGTHQGKNRTYYAGRSTEVKGKTYHFLMHRVIMSRILDRELSVDEFVDHVDRNPLNNRRSNLRLATRSQNQANRKRAKHNKSGLKGVKQKRGERRWTAKITVNGRVIYLGRFDTAEEAHEAYRQAAVKYFGEFARFE